MKIGIITDQHFGARKGNKNLHEYFAKFYDEIFFPSLEKNNIKTIIDMGDTFDTRKGIDFWSLNWAKERYYNVLRDMGINVHTIVGNHTAYYKDTNKINSVDLLLREYDNIFVYSSPTEVVFEDLKVLMLPWINEENRKESMDMIKSTDAKIVCSHLEMKGFYANKTYMNDHGEDKANFSHFVKVFSGHYHHRSNQDNVYYLGNPYEIYWHDLEETRGYNILDTNTLDHVAVNNPHRLFYNIYYNDTPIEEIDTKIYKNKIVKVIVKKKSSTKDFEHFIDTLYASNVNDLKIVENYNFAEYYSSNGDRSSDDLESENTLSILNKYIEDSKIDLDNSILKGILEKVYNSACEVE